MLLSSTGIPAGGVALIMGVDRILDMCRTAINVSGDIVACTLMDKWVGSSKSAQEEFAEQQQREDQRRVTGQVVLGGAD